MQSAPIRFLIGLGYAMSSKTLRTTGLNSELCQVKQLFIKLQKKRQNYS